MVLCNLIAFMNFLHFWFAYIPTIRLASLTANLLFHFFSSSCLPILISMPCHGMPASQPTSFSGLSIRLLDNEYGWMDAWMNGSNRIGGSCVR